MRRRLHRLCAWLIGSFGGLHLLNHLAVLAGESAHLEMMEALRAVYRAPAVEVVLLGALGLQIATGVGSAAGAWRRASSRFERLQVWTGLYLATFLCIHVTAVLAGRLVLRLDTNLYFAAAGLNSFPLNLFFAPYYGLAIVSLFAHLAAAHARTARRRVAGLAPAEQAAVLVALGVLVAVAALWGLTDGFQGLAVPASYSVLTGRKGT